MGFDGSGREYACIVVNAVNNSPDSAHWTILSWVERSIPLLQWSCPSALSPWARFGFLAIGDLWAD